MDCRAMWRMGHNPLFNCWLSLSRVNGSPGGQISTRALMTSTTSFGFLAEASVASTFRSKPAASTSPTWHTVFNTAADAMRMAGVTCKSSSDMAADRTASWPTRAVDSRPKRAAVLHSGLSGKVAKSSKNASDATWSPPILAKRARQCAISALSAVDPLKPFRALETPAMASALPRCTIETSAWHAGKQTMSPCCFSWQRTADTAPSGSGVPR
mmetsp:Transcript_121871/g.356198  ORF Transcript_121871/g.356198 Transcript_121871/m.356198 type:complete len:213 (-) Transcript_121871:1552-2190(-)